MLALKRSDSPDQRSRSSPVSRTQRRSEHEDKEELSELRGGKRNTETTRRCRREENVTVESPDTPPRTTVLMNEDWTERFHDNEPGEESGRVRVITNRT